MIEARRGAAALEMVEKVIPNLILLDIGMPEMDGLTNISNRHYFDRIFDKEWRRATAAV